MNRSVFHLYPPTKEGTRLPAIVASEHSKEVYLPSEALAAAVNVALALGQPLLLTGKPGTGKTRLAYHLAQSFDLEGPFVFNAQTTSAKKDLFYAYDALGHFQWAQNAKNEPLTTAQQMIDKHFIRFEALGEAIALARDNGKQSVVLIDEIDKAPRDLPNDLLMAIEELAFDISEVPGRKSMRVECPASLRPLIVITSNSEKDLPEAFLRRVVYHHIDFPKKEKLITILQKKGVLGLQSEDVEPIVDHFLDIQNYGLQKEPATAEMIAWAALLPKMGFPIQKLKDVKSLDNAEKDLLHASYGVLAKNQEDLTRLLAL